MKYSIDTSAILDGWRRYYPPDVLPDVWTGFDDLIKKGHLAATEEVLVELEKRDDEVHKWAKKRKKMFVPIDDAIQKAVSLILGAHEKLVDTRKNRSAADPFVIGLAQIQGCTVVTGERATGSADRPNIPDVCTVLGIRSIAFWISSEKRAGASCGPGRAAARSRGSSGHLRQEGVDGAEDGLLIAT